MAASCVDSSTEHRWNYIHSLFVHVGSDGTVFRACPETRKRKCAVSQICLWWFSIHVRRPKWPKNPVLRWKCEQLWNQGASLIHNLVELESEHSDSVACHARVHRSDLLPVAIVGVREIVSTDIRKRLTVQTTTTAYILQARPATPLGESRPPLAGNALPWSNWRCVYAIVHWVHAPSFFWVLSCYGIDVQC